MCRFTVAVAVGATRLRHRDLSAKDWASKLANEVPALLANVDDDSLVLDLRWIQPVDDVALVAALVGHESVVKETTEPSPQAAM